MSIKRLAIRRLSKLIYLSSRSFQMKQNQEIPPELDRELLQMSEFIAEEIIEYLT